MTEPSKDHSSCGIPRTSGSLVDKNGFNWVQKPMPKSYWDEVNMTKAIEIYRNVMKKSHKKFSNPLWRKGCSTVGKTPSKCNSLTFNDLNDKGFDFKTDSAPSKVACVFTKSKCVPKKTKKHKKKKKQKKKKTKKHN